MGLIAAQIRITGDLEKDQQLLIYGIGGLIGLIVLAMIIIVVVVVVRRSKSARAVSMPVAVPTPPKENSYKPAESIPEAKPEIPEVKPEPVVEKVAEPVAEVIPEPVPVPEEKPVTVVPEQEPPMAQPVQTQEETSSKKYDFGAYKEELAHQNADDKMDEIRRRLEEIKRQRQAEPAPVLPKVEVKPTAIPEVTPATEADPDPIVPEEEIVAEEEMDETRPINEIPEDPETVSVTEVSQVERLEPMASFVPEDKPVLEDEVSKEEPIQEEVALVEVTPEPRQETPAEEITQESEPEEVVEREAEIRSEGETYYAIKDEPVMELQRDAQPEAPLTSSPKEKDPETGLPNGKFLPMKKLTFAEWVELFK